MTDLFGLVPSHLDEYGSGATVYDEAAIRQHAHEVHLLAGGNGLFAIRDDDGRLSFMVFDLFTGPATRDGVIVDCAKWERVFHGYGFGNFTEPYEGLRECRHTWWGDGAGYVPSPNATVIAEAFSKLGRWFDL